MQTEGMVHALEIAHSLLKKDGLLIDIHPTGQPPQVEAHVGEEIHLAGHLQEKGNFLEKNILASDALKAVTGRGLFGLERDGLFTFLTHAPTITTLADHLASEWTDAVLDEEPIERAAGLMGEPGADREIVLREIVHIARFRVSGRQG
jgi:hypothetical protein